VFGLFKKAEPVPAPVPVNKLRQVCLSLVDLIRDTVNWTFDCPVFSYVYVVYRNGINYTKVSISQWGSTQAGRHHMKNVKNKKKIEEVLKPAGEKREWKEVELNIWGRMKERVKASKCFLQAAVLKFAKSSGTYKNL